MNTPLKGTKIGKGGACCKHKRATESLTYKPLAQVAYNRGFKEVILHFQDHLLESLVAHPHD